MVNSGRFLLALTIACAGGCVTRGNVELLESELRQQENHVYHLQTQLTESESDLEVARKELRTLRDELARKGELNLLPEQVESLYRVKGVKVNKFFTGGLDRDGEPGDDLLNVVLSPVDEHGETVKLPGELEIEAIDLSSPGSARSLGVWRYSTEEVAEHWQSGLTSGFQFRMPWHKLPSSSDIVLHARYATVDGRRFGTSQEIKIDPMIGTLADSEPPAPNPPEAPPPIEANPFAMDTDDEPIDQTAGETEPAGSPQLFELGVSSEGEQKPPFVLEPKVIDQKPEPPKAPPAIDFQFPPMPSPPPAKSRTETGDAASISKPIPTEPDSLEWGWTSLDGEESVVPEPSRDAR